LNQALQQEPRSKVRWLVAGLMWSAIACIFVGAIWFFKAV